MESGAGRQVIGDRYQLLELLGSGSMGMVYLAVDLQSGERVALKRVTPAPGSLLAAVEADDDEDRQALMEEFRILSSLDHPNIVSVFDCDFDEDGRPFYTMEYLQGEWVTLFCTDKPVEVKVELLRQMFVGLAYLHQRDVLQRDLKPANILVIDGQLKLTDFGLAACETRSSHLVTNLMGTAAYMAPELLMGEEPSTASDLYAAGTIAYEVLVGRHPFDVQNMNRLILSVLHEAPDLEALPDDLRDLVGSLMAKDVEERPGSAEEVGKGLGMEENR